VEVGICDFEAAGSTVLDGGTAWESGDVSLLQASERLEAVVALCVALLKGDAEG